MDKESLKLLNDINRAIIRYRGVYSLWAKKHNISYNEMLVLYTLRDIGFCRQKMICDDYLLPRQTINNVITDMRNRGLLEISREHCIAREKAFVLTEKGKDYAKVLFDSLDNIEAQAVEIIGKENLKTIANEVLSFDNALNTAIEKEG